MQINRYKNCDNIGVKMISILPNDDIKYFQKEKCKYEHFRDGAVKYPYDKSVVSIGYLGEGIYNPQNQPRAYNIWKHMLTRCDFSYNTKRPTYETSIPDPYFQSFQNFAEWYNCNYYEFPNERMDLDKDILCKRNKIYHPNLCIFVPQYINTLVIGCDSKRGELPIGVQFDKGNSINSYITKVSVNGVQKYLGSYPTPEEAFNVYKIAKEEEIKRIANLYWFEKGGKDIPQFEKVYLALLGYQVEITD